MSYFDGLQSENQYFKPDEFDSPDLPGSGGKMDLDFIEKLTVARFNANTPFFITSGYRTEKYNYEVGGAVGSAHRKGLACDIDCDNSQDRYKIIRALLRVGFTRIGIGKNFIHVDSDTEKPQNVIWMY